MTDEFEKYRVHAEPDEFEQYRAQQEESPQETKGFGGIAQDAFQGALQGLLGLPGALMNIPIEGYGAGKQLLTDPKRAAQNIGGSFGSLGHGILSAPGNIRDYLARKDIVSQDASSLRLPESVIPKEYDYQEALGREGHQIGDELLGSTASGLFLSPLGKAAGALTSKIPSVSSKGIASKISADKAIIKNTFREKYGDLFKNAEKAGLKEVEKPKINTNIIEKNSMPKYHKALLDFNKNPTLANAHLAQSDLGKMIRSFEKSPSPLGSHQIKAFKEAIDAQNKIKESMFASSPKLAQKYKEITHGYAKEVIPYSANKAIGQFERGELSAKKLVQRLKNNDAFMLAIGKKYPGIKANQLLNNKLSKGVLYSLIAGGTAAKGINVLKD